MKKSWENIEEKKNEACEYDLNRFQDRSDYHTYSIDHISLFISFVLSGCASLRGASRCFEIITTVLGINRPVPTWYSGRLWLLRLGYYKLQRAKQKADDWIWIVDHTIQVGKEKCMLILGIRQSRLPPIELYLDHEDVEPIALFPVENSNGEAVYQQLNQAALKTGIPRQIISDHGSDIHCGVNRFCLENPHSCFIYDIKHKTAAILKRELKDDQQWNKFIKRSSQTRKRVLQTDLAALAPPNQRSKSRYLNIDTLVNWGQRMLCYLDIDQSEIQDSFDSKKIKNKLGWIRQYRNHLKQWQELFEVVKNVEDYIKFVGIFDDCHIRLKRDHDCHPTTNQAKQIQQELLVFIEQQSQNALPGERLLGSSEVIESVFGKFKYLQHTQAKSGFTSMVLSIAASVSKTTQDTIKKAMETVPTKKISQWFEDMTGHKSLQAKRIMVINQIEKAGTKTG